ncbi:hydroxybutyrate-dimer hydrolase [Burkholderiaceae bacterium]|nr:hydroxybutyrate-dimer hydrolase [Burkholderiaceae bacterium]
MTGSRNEMRLAALALMVATLTACGGSDDPAPPPPPPPPPPATNALPTGVTHHSVTTYSAIAVGSGTTADTQDLLTAGLGKTGLGAAAPPAYADPSNPTAMELRRNAIHANYRGILDFSANGGYGTLYGPNVDVSGNVTADEGLIPGKEYIGSLDDGTGNKKVVYAVQIPSSFDVDNPCIVAGPSSGSRGVYGSISSAAEWALKRGCAVTLTDAGKGPGLYDPTDDTVMKIDGTRATRTDAGALSFFAAAVTDAARAAYNAVFPNRVAMKQAHSQKNPEKDWGTDTLASIKYALYALNQEYADTAPDGSSKLIRFTADNTLVIAGSVSNGGAAVLQAAEQDTEGLIDGVVANEPSAQPASTTGYGVSFGGVDVPTVGKSLVDYFTYANIYQPCAVLAADATMAEVSFYNFMTLTGMNARATNRCTALAAKGLVSGGTTAEQAADALAKMRFYGWEPQHDTMHNFHYGIGNAPIVAMIYSNAPGRFSYTDNLCGVSAAYVGATGVPAAPSAAQALQKAQLFAVGNGTINGVPATVVYNDSVGGAVSWALATSPSTGLQDFALDSALCQRALVTGKDAVTGADLSEFTVPTAAQSQRVRDGIAEFLLNGNLRGKPTLIAAGRSDALVIPNHNARAYAAFNQSVEGAASQLRYIEVTNAQHFDTLIPQSGLDTRFVPLHVYFNRSMDAMYEHLTTGAALPPSQVVRTTPRGGTPGAAPAITAANVPNFVAAPAAADLIDFDGSTLSVPN